jgi:hypothetical protein
MLFGMLKQINTVVLTLAAPLVDASGFMTLSHEDIAKYFAADVSAAEANLVAVTQGPVRNVVFDEKVATAAWRF